PTQHARLLRPAGRAPGPSADPGGADTSTVGPHAERAVPQCRARWTGAGHLDPPAAPARAAPDAPLLVRPGARGAARRDDAHGAQRRRAAAAPGVRGALVARRRGRVPPRLRDRAAAAP